MKAAILIMAHRQPTHLAKLVESLLCDWAYIFIHIDKKVDISEFRRCISQHRNVIFVDYKNRVRVNWGGFSQVEATLSLLDASLNFEEHFDRFCLLSGSDFPIKPLSKIKAAFDSEIEYISIEKLLDDSNNNNHCKYVKYFYFRDSRLSSIINQLPKIPRRVYNNISLYWGSQWWALTHECVRYILNFIKHNEDYISFHKYTLVPDEIFFHSIVKNSPFSANISHDFEKVKDPKSYFDSNERGCHYIDWNAKGTSLPKVLDESDISNLISSKSLFARKLQKGPSDKLVQMIEKIIKC